MTQLKDMTQGRWHRTGTNRKLIQRKSSYQATLVKRTMQEQIENNQRTTVQGRAILQPGLYAQLRSRPTTHQRTPHVAPTKPVSSPIQ